MFKQTNANTGFSKQTSCLFAEQILFSKQTVCLLKIVLQSQALVIAEDGHRVCFLAKDCLANKLFAKDLLQSQTFVIAEDGRRVCLFAKDVQQTNIAEDSSAITSACDCRTAAVFACLLKIV